MLKCAKCKGLSKCGTSIKLRKSDTCHKMVCIPCFEKLMHWREKRGIDRYLNEHKNRNATLK